MVRDAEAGLINMILVKDLSRFGRDYIETGRYTDEVFPALGVRFIALMDNIDSEGNDDLLPFRSILNENHVNQTGLRVSNHVLKSRAVVESTAAVAVVDVALHHVPALNVSVLG